MVRQHTKRHYGGRDYDPRYCVYIIYNIIYYTPCTRVILCKFNTVIGNYRRGTELINYEERLRIS